MTGLTGYKHWEEIFDENVSNVWIQEPIPILKNISMLIFSIKREIKKIQNILNSDISLLRKSVYKSQFASVSELSKDKIHSKEPEIMENSLTKSNNKGLIQPLKEISNDDSNSIVISDEELCSSKTIDSSPEIKKNAHCGFKRRLKRRQLLKENNNLQKQNQSLSNASTSQKVESDLDSSVVQCSPIHKPKDSFLHAIKRKKHKSVNSTLTQMFLTTNMQDNNKLSTSLINNKTQETSCSNIESMIGITNIVSCLNQDTEKSNYLEDSSLNSAMIEEGEELNEFIAKAQNVSNQLETAPKVQDKAIQNFPAWCCKDCERFYKRQSLTPEEILKLIGKCSKHHEKYKPREDTLPGFWDMNIITPGK